MSGKRGVHGGAQTAGQRTGGGVVRRVDELGRIVIPVEIRKRFGIAVRDPLEIGVRGESIVLSKPHDSCVFCGRNDRLAEFKGRMVCHDCRVDLVDLVSSDR
jgi:transcriptional pleiotropic regulator of transition state genes